MTTPAGRSSIGVRVRPNSHDFIRQLSADLKTKKYTFYVDVDAKTGPATRTVREWAATSLKKISAVVPVSANTAKASADVADWRRRQAGIKTTVKVYADVGHAQRVVEAWRQYASRDLEIKVKADVSGRGGNVEGIRRRLSQDIKVGVKADTSQMKRDIAGDLDQPGLFSVGIDADTKKAKFKINEFFADVQGEQLVMDLGIDTKPAVAKVSAVKKGIAKDPITAQLDLDTKRARLKLLELRVQKLSKTMEVKVEVKKSGLDRAAQALSQLEKGFGGTSLIRSLDFGPLNLGKPTGLVGTLTTLTALAGLVPAVVTGVSALSKAFMDLAGAAAIAPGAIGGVLASLATFSVATNGVGDTLGALFDTWNQGASETASTARRSVQAHAQLRSALHDEAKAQEDVGQARHDALGDLRDLNNELRGGVLNEAQAILDLQKARDRYAQGGFENATDEAQGRLDIASAEQRLIDTRERNLNLGDRAQKADAKGIEGSDRVVDALEAQRRATEAVATATEAIASTQATGALGKFNDQLGLLSPNAQNFILTIGGMKAEVLEFRNSLQDTFFQGLGPGVQGLFDNLMPVVGPGMQRIAAAMNATILQAFDTLGSDDGQSIIARVLGGTAGAQEALTQIIDPLIKGFGTLTAAGAEHLPQIIDLIGTLTERFATFIDNADKDGTLDSFMDRGVEALGYVAEIAINMLKVTNDLGKAFDGNLLKTLSDMTARWHEFLSSEEGQAKLKEFIKEAGDLWEDWRPVLEDLPGIFSAASSAAQAFIGALTPFLNLFTEVMEHAPWLVQAFVGAWAGAKILTGVLTPILTVVGWLNTGLAKSLNMLRLLKGTPIPGAGGAPGAPLGATAAGGAASSGLSTVAAAVPFVAVAGGFALLANEIYKNSSEEDKQVAGTKITTDDLANARAGGRGTSANRGANEQKRAEKVFGDDGKPPAFGTPEYAFLAKSVKDGKFQSKFPQIGVNDDGHLIDITTGQVLPGFEDGGYTNWGKSTGKVAMLHGKEYIQPADTVDHYGIGAMKAIHDKSIPKEFFTGFEGGGWIDPKDPTRTQNPEPGILGSLLEHGSSGLSSVASNVGSMANGISSGVGTGPLPGPAPGMDLSLPGTTPISTNIMGVNVPLGGIPAGWPGGQAPIGLGGGADGFDIRKFGIGPGPVGSTPSDWVTWGADFLKGTVTKFGDALLSGALDFVGLGGLSSYGNAAKGIAGHFGDSIGGSKASGPGAAESVGDVNSLLATYGSMPTNGAYPALPSLPGVFDPATGSALPAGKLGGLQKATALGERVIRANFPWATNIGGVRADALKWHPSGLALDVMTDPSHANNEPPSPEGLARGNQLYAWLNANKQALGIDYMLWQEKDHYNHIHVNFAPSGYPDGSAPAALPTTTPVPAAAKSGGKGGNGWGGGAGAPKIPAGPLGPGTPSSPPLVPWPKFTRDGGGWLPTGTSVVENSTGAPEYVVPPTAMRSFMAGGYNMPAAIVPPKPTPPPLPPRGPDIRQITPRAPTAAPKPSIPPVIPTAPPVGPSAPPPPDATDSAPGPGGEPINTGAIRPATGVAPGDSGDHVLPAIATGIASTASTLGSIAQQAASFGMMAGGMGAGGAMGGMGGGGGGIGGLSISGLFQQGGKIATNVANVASSFLVGNITGGTTENPYGVTQRGSVPSGGSRMVDASNNQYGDIYTNNLDEFFARKDRIEKQRAQSSLGRWGNA